MPSRYNTGRPSWFGGRPESGEHKKKDRRKERWSRSNYSCPINKLSARNCTLLCIPSKANLNQQSVISKAHHDQLLVEQLRGIRQMSPAHYYREYTKACFAEAIYVRTNTRTKIDVRWPSIFAFPIPRASLANISSIILLFSGFTSHHDVVTFYWHQGSKMTVLECHHEVWILLEVNLDWIALDSITKTHDAEHYLTHD